jgi:hypothetical protein
VKYRVSHGAAPRAGVKPEELKAFNKRPMATVSDDELAQYYVPVFKYLSDVLDVKPETGESNVVHEAVQKDETSSTGRTETGL